MKLHTFSQVRSYNRWVKLAALTALGAAQRLCSLWAAGLAALTALAAVGRFALRSRALRSQAAALTSLSAAQLAALASRAERVQLRANSVIFRQDAPADRLYLLVRGEVELLRRGGDGVYAPVALLGAGSWLGAVGLLGRAHHPVAAKATSDIEALALDREVLASLLASEGSEVVTLLPPAVAREMPARLQLLGDALRRVGHEAALALLL